MSDTSAPPVAPPKTVGQVSDQPVAGVPQSNVQPTPSPSLSPAATSNGGTSGTGGMGYPEVENTWIQAGGNPQSAAMAAAVADASSGFNPQASRTNPDGTTSVGLWLIPKNGMPPGSTDPIANARAAIQLSSNGTDWSQWCVTWSDNNCGEDGGTYLGSGANALGSLGQRLTPSSYNVIGAAPSGSGVGASAATSTGTSTGSGTTKKSNALYILVILGVVAAAIYFGRQRTQQPGESPVTPGSPDDAPKPVVIPAHVRGIPHSDTTGPYAP